MNWFQEARGEEREEKKGEEEKTFQADFEGEGENGNTNQPKNERLKGVKEAFCA